MGTWPHEAFALNPLMSRLWSDERNGPLSGPAYDGWTLRRTRTTVRIIPHQLAYRTIALTFFALVIVVPAILILGLTRGEKPRPDDIPVFEAVAAAFGI